MIPYQIWLVLLLLAVICTGYLFFVHDRNNYSEAIVGVVAVIMWVLSGMYCAAGLTYDVNADPYTSVTLMWIFVAIGVVVGLITIVKILDIVTARKKDKDSRANMSPIRL